MPQRPFVHLHCHTHYSLLDGASRVPELIELVQAQGMNACAMTDHGNLFGAIEFYSECKQAGINPIVGYEAYVAPGKRTEREAKKRGEAGFHLTLLAKNTAGFQNLVKLASIAYLDGYYYVPRIDKALLEAHSDGLICLSGCASSEFSEFILKEEMDEARELAGWFANIFGKNFYVEIQNNGLDIQKRCADGAIDIANRLGLPLVATSDAHYLRQGDHFAHDVLLCINTKRLLKDENRMRYGSDQFYVRPPEQMYELFPGHEDAVKRSQEIADGVDIQLDFKKRHFPVFTPPKGKKADDYLRELAFAGLKERYGHVGWVESSKPTLGTEGGFRRLHPPYDEHRYQQALLRLEHELGVIRRMGFASYFLIVWDFVRFAHSKNIPAAARGSACGALVSYVLKLSDVCPLEYDLLFERFLDPNRSEAPDIDIDFCQDRREEVLQYVREKYGAESVAQIATFGTMAAKAAIKDVGRVLDVPLDRVNRLTAMVPKVLNITLPEALAQSADLKREYDNDPETRKLIDIAIKLEGTNRNVGTHAAGVVIADGPIINFVPVQRVMKGGYENGSRGGDLVTTTQWTMGDLEKVGMLKIDFLGLRTLTVIDNTLKLIEKTRGEKLDLTRIPMNDTATYALLQRGDARGVFQLESDGIRDLLKRMKPDNIRDLIATNALYRPGPLGGGMVDAYVNRKHGREKPYYDHPVMEEILAETHGVITYQEQCMRVLNRLGGIELASAYACIKAISKKKQDVIDQRHAEFIKGAQERGVSQEVAEKIFGLIVQFAGYGFNKSHSAAYALLGYRTAYLKTHYPAEFMAALLSSEIDDSNKRDNMVEHIEDARRLGAVVLTPDVQVGEPDFTVKDGKIVFGLTAIKGLGRGAAQEILRARQAGGPFKDFFDFCERIDHKIVPKAALEKMIKAGAFDSLAGGKRAALLDALPGAMDAAGQTQNDRRHGQGNLFESFGDATPEVASTSGVLSEVPEWSPSAKLKYEKEALDFYISSHPLAQVGDAIQRFASHSIGRLGDLEHNTEVFVGGMFAQVRLMNTKKPGRNGNSRYVRCKLEDFSGNVECVMWPDDFVQFKDLIGEDQICFVQGFVEKRTDQPVLLMTKVLTVEQGKKERTTGLLLVMDAGDDPAKIDAISQTLHRSPRGSTPVFLYVRDAAGKYVRLKAGDDLRINPENVAKTDLEMILGHGRVEFTRANGRSS